MFSDSFNFLFSNIWSVFLIIFFFGGSIFVHELGHFIAARRRGLKVERFSIGFGPKIFGWKKDGIEYRISLLPLGGYVALPQLADLSMIEGKNESDPKALQPISYSDKMIVAVMGAVFNLIFALILSLIVWWSGQPVLEANQTTTVGYVIPSILLAEDTEVEGPAYKAGLMPGDKILKVDRNPVKTFQDIQKYILTGVGRDDYGKPKTILKINREGVLIDVEVYPQLVEVNITSGDRMRSIGIIPSESILVDSVMEFSPAQKAGISRGDIILEADDKTLYSLRMLNDLLHENPEKEHILKVKRGQEFLMIPVKPEKVPFTKSLSVIKPRGSSDEESWLFLEIQNDARSANEVNIKKSIVVFDIPRMQKNKIIQIYGKQMTNLEMGFVPGDKVLTINGMLIKDEADFREKISQFESAGCLITVIRHGSLYDIRLRNGFEVGVKPPMEEVMIGIGLKSKEMIVHLTPWEQFSENISMTFHTLKSLMDRRSDIGLNHLMGPPGIARVMHTFSLQDLRLVIAFTILININLAILNLLPLPVLDGGQMLFATISKMLGRPLNTNLIAWIQGSFVVILFSLMIYVSFFDIRRWQGDNRYEELIRQREHFYIDIRFSAH